MGRVLYDHDDIRWQALGAFYDFAREHILAGGEDVKLTLRHGHVYYTWDELDESDRFRFISSMWGHGFAESIQQVTWYGEPL